MYLDFGTYDIRATMPRMFLARQKVPDRNVANVAAEVRRRLLGSGLLGAVGPGKRIAITAGSRGIGQISTVTRAVVDTVRELGGEPFVVPAMGSHGGATAEGQVSLLGELGITEESIGTAIRATMDVEPLGRLPGGPELYMDANAAKADGIIVVNRVKPHSDFHGPIESGLAKMTVIGLGKRHGADAMHAYGAPGLRTLLTPAAQMIASKKPILAGVAVLENGLHSVAKIAVLPPAEFGGQAEKRLLREAWKLLPGLPFDDLDVLVIDYMGKNFSGAGMDTNVIGRVNVPAQKENARPRITAVVTLDVSPESHGNVAGLGLADVITRRLVEKIDFYAFYLNSITAGTFGLRRGSLPFVMQDDRTAVALGLHAAAASHPTEPRLVRIKNTLEIEELMISEALRPEAEAKGVEILRELGELSFGPEGIIEPWPGARELAHV